MPFELHVARPTGKAARWEPSVAGPASELALAYPGVEQGRAPSSCGDGGEHREEGGEPGPSTSPTPGGGTGRRPPEATSASSARPAKRSSPARLWVGPSASRRRALWRALGLGRHGPRGSPTSSRRERRGLGVAPNGVLVAHGKCLRDRGRVPAKSRRRTHANEPQSKVDVCGDESERRFDDVGARETEQTYRRISKCSEDLRSAFGAHLRAIFVVGNVPMQAHIAT